MRKKRVCLTTEVIFIGATSHKKRKTIRLLAVQHYPESCNSLVEQLIILQC